MGFLPGLIGSVGYGQQAEIDSLKRQLATQPADTIRVRLLTQLGRLYLYTKPDTAYRLAQQTYQLARQSGDRRGQALGLMRISTALQVLGDYPKSIRLGQQALQISRAVNDLDLIFRVTNNLAIPYAEQQQFDRALPLFKESLQSLRRITRQSGRYNTLLYATTYGNLGEAHLNLNQLDSADYYSKLALRLARQPAGSLNLAIILNQLGSTEARRGNAPAALSYYQQALQADGQNGPTVQKADAYLGIAQLYRKTGPADSARANARRSLTNSQQANHPLIVLKASQLLTQLYEGRDDAQALRYYKVAVAAKDSLFGQRKVREMLTLNFEEQQRAQELAAAEEAAKADYQNRLRIYGLSALVGVAALIALLMWRANRRQRRTNALLSRQKEEIDQQRTTAQQALTDLQAAQTRLIHQEKLASLGELTAGIAHEIQNPLNFVNNFAEVSNELIDELEEERRRPQRDTELEDELLTDLRQNLSKIHHHGRRADLIVKGMLAHSRQSTGSKQPTNLNTLADEYLKLAYQGFRAKDKDSNAHLVVDLDPSVGKVDVVPQDVGRVLLNLFNNALYAVRQKQQLSQVPAGAGPDEPGAESYHPTVWVATRRVDGQPDRRAVEITVRDNGVGIPESVQQKMFQPFFTTKPTGEGTGLGLSLSYDIITKGHGGTITVDSQPSDYTLITLHLPG